MRLVNQFITALLVGGFIGGCSTPPSRDQGADGGAEIESTDEVVVLPFEEPRPLVDQLDSDIVFNILSGEVAIQRGELMQGYEHQLLAAELSGDPGAAERAARLALMLNDQALAVEAVQRWVELAPNDLSARQLAAAVQFKVGDLEAAFVQLQAVVSISQARDEDGFLHAMAALSRERGGIEATELMQRLADAYPEDPRALYAVALTAMLGKHYEAALGHANELVSRHPDWVRGYLLLSRIHVAQENKSEALQLLGEVVKRFPQEPLLRSAYGRILLDVDQLDASYTQFLSLKALTPDDGDVYFFLGIIALELNRYEDAREHFLALGEKDKQQDKAAFYLGRTEELLNAPEKAIQWYRKVRRGSLVYEAQVRSARLMAEKGDLAVAQDWLQGLRIRLPKRAVELYLIEVELLREYGTHEQVMALFEMALQAHPGDPDLLYGRALYAVTQGHLDILERDLRQVIEDNPQHADALNALGYTLADQTDRFQEALDLITQALTLKPDAPAILDSMGWVLYRLGKHAEALEYLQRAMSMLPDAEIAAHYGEVLWVMGRQEQAKEVWEGALEKDPESEHVLKVMRRLGLKSVSE